MDLCSGLCSMLVILLVIYILVEVEKDRDQQQAKEEEETKKWIKEIENKQQYLQYLIGEFYRALEEFFTGKIDLPRCSQTLSDEIHKMQSENHAIMEMIDEDVCSEEITECENLKTEFSRFSQVWSARPFYTQMIDMEQYGAINPTYWNAVRSLSRENADAIIQKDEAYFSAKEYNSIFQIDTDALYRCMWFYASEKPYAADCFQSAVSLLNRLLEKPCIDVMIAECYAFKQMGGENILHERIKKELDNKYSAGELVLIASGLMWMKAYTEEKMVLQYMLQNGMPMPAKVQERLHALSSGTAAAPDNLNVSSNENILYFDVTALAWKDSDYAGLFENLSFQENKLTYSLAVRDETKELSLPLHFDFPSDSVILRKIQEACAAEYDQEVTAKAKQCVSRSKNSEERLNCIVVETTQCCYMSILIYMVKVGRKLNIKFYTLFTPQPASIAEQEQQAISLRNKLSPSASMWESSIKDTVLMGIQQLLNTSGGQAASQSDAGPDAGAPMF